MRLIMLTWDRSKSRSERKRGSSFEKRTNYFPDFLRDNFADSHIHTCDDETTMKTDLV